MHDAAKAIRNDGKNMSFRSFNGPLRVGQLTVWDGPAVLAKHQSTFKQTLAADSPDWCMNLISISEGCSYFVTDNPKVQSWLTHLLGVTFDGPIAKANRLWLRKEMIKQDLSTSV